MIRPEDDSFHPGSSDPYWNESSWFGFTVPDRLMNGWVYFYHRPNMKYSVGGVAMWDPTGEYQWNCRYYDWGETVALPDGADMYNFCLASGLTVKLEEAQRRYQLGYAGDGCTLDLNFTGVAPPIAAGATGFPAGTDDWGKGHYNQPGHVTGVIQLHGERIEVDCHSARDRSWGPRRLTSNPRGSFASAVANERSGFLAMSVSDRPRDTDPCVGVPDPTAFGWYLCDGVTSPLVTGARTVLERDDRGRPRRMELAATDELGRELHAEGTARSWLHWHGYAFMFQFWTLVEWQLDGQRVFGEDQDFFPTQQARRLIRSLGQHVPGGDVGEGGGGAN